MGFSTLSFLSCDTLRILKSSIQLQKKELPPTSKKHKSLIMVGFSASSFLYYNTLSIPKSSIQLFHPSFTYWLLLPQSLCPCILDDLTHWKRGSQWWPNRRWRADVRWRRRSRGRPGGPQYPRSHRRTHTSGIAAADPPPSPHWSLRKAKQIAKHFLFIQAF